MTAAMDDAVAALDPVLSAMSAASEAAVWRLERLTPREKVFISIVANACQSTLGLPFERHLELGRRHGVTIADIRELIRFASYDTGYPIAVAAMQRLAELDRSLGETSTDACAAERVATHASGADNPLPDYVRARLDDLGADFGGFMAMQSRMRRDSTLDGRERAFATLAIDVVYGTLGDTLRMHAIRALAAGADRETIREAICFTAQFGAARAWDALGALERVLSEVDPKTRPPLLTAVSTSNAKHEANKKTVLAFYDAGLRRRDFEAASALIGDRYVQHNPLIADGREGLRSFLGMLSEKFPSLQIEISKIFAEGDFVVAHVHGVREPGQRGSAIVDIFKLEDGLIVEHWDVIQPIPEEQANPNGMF